MSSELLTMYWDTFKLHTHQNCIRRHVCDVYLGMCPVQNGVSYLNVLGRFSETSQTAEAKIYTSVYINYTKK